MSFICHIHNYTEYNQQWNVFSAFNPSKCTHTWSSGQPTLRRPGSSWEFGALLKGLTSVVDNSCRSRDSKPTTSGYKSDALSIKATTEYATQLCDQAHKLTRFDYCNALLAGLPANSIKILQLVQNAAARLIFNEPKRMHVAPLFINLHWLPIAARIKFKALMFAYRTTSGSAPLYLNALLQTYVPSRSLFRILIYLIKMKIKV